MKRNAVKSFSAVILVIILIFSAMCTCFAETIQDNVEAWLEGLVDEYESAETDEERASIQEQLNSFVEENGLEDIDLSGLSDTDIGQIVGDITGGGSAIDDFMGLASDAWSSGIAMIQDVFSKGLGTSDGSNTATTNASQTSPNVIVAEPTTAEASTKAVGISISTVPTTVAAPTTVNSAEVTTYNVGETTAANLIGSGVTTTELTTAGSVVSDDGVPASSVVVLVVLSVATLAVIVAIVVFFVLKRK